MSDFEFLRDLPIGQYLPGNSLIHRLDPRTRIVCITAFLLALTFETHPLALAVGVVAALGGWALAKLSPRPAWRGWKAALPFLLILAVIQVFFHVSMDESVALFQVFGKTITSADLTAGANLILRFSAYVVALALASSTLSSSEITRALNSLLKPLTLLRLPVRDFVMVIQVTLRFFPLLAQTAERITKAQAARGADWDAHTNFITRVRRILPVIVPLFVISLRRAENMALAMDARAYGCTDRRSSMFEMHFTGKDWAAMGIMTALIALMIWL